MSRQETLDDVGNFNRLLKAVKLWGRDFKFKPMFISVCVDKAEGKNSKHMRSGSVTTWLVGKKHNIHNLTQQYLCQNIESCQDSIA